MKRDRTKKTHTITRRQFLKGSAVAAAGFLAPTIVPASVFGADAPSNRITIGFVGVGRMGMGDLRELLGRKEAQIVAVCDVNTGSRGYKQVRLPPHRCSRHSLHTLYRLEVRQL